MRLRASIAALLLVPLTQACTLRVFDRWDGQLVQATEIAETPQNVWRRITGEARDAGLLIAALDDEARVLQFSWLPAPGDGSHYLTCAGGRAGSAVLRPRIALIETDRGTLVQVSTLAHATAGAGCTSNGRFEAALLDELYGGAVSGAVAASRAGTR